MCIAFQEQLGKDNENNSTVEDISAILGPMVTKELEQQAQNDYYHDHDYEIPSRSIRQPLHHELALGALQILRKDK